MKEKKKQSVFIKLLEDKKAIRECLINKEDIKKLAEKRGIKFVTPV